MQWRHEFGKTILKKLAEKIRASRNHCGVLWDKLLGRIVFDSFGVPAWHRAGTQEKPDESMNDGAVAETFTENKKKPKKVEG